MIDIPTEELTVERYEGPGAWVDGKWVKPAPTILLVDASVQPAKPNEIKMLPEHIRTSEVVKIYTDTRLITVDEKNKLTADIIIHDNKRFQVHKSANWAIGTDIPFYKFFAAKEDGEGGGDAA